MYGTSATFGWVNAAWGVGTVTGVVLGSRMAPLRPMRSGMIAAMWWPGAIALFAAGPPLVVLYPGDGRGRRRDRAVRRVVGDRPGAAHPGHLLSRVSAWDWMGSLALLPLGYLLAGPAAHGVGGAHVLEYGGVLGVLAGMLGLMPRSTRTLRRLDDAAPLPSAAFAALGSAGP